jgi:hypothetical protein
MGQQLKIPFIDGMKVGLGFDMLTGKANSTPAVIGKSITAPQQAGGQTITTTFRLVQEIDALHEALGISVSVGGGYAGFEASAKMKFAQECSVTQYCLYVVIAVEVMNSCLTIDSPALVPDAIDLLRTNDMSRFRERFGNRYVSGVKTGGEYYAVFRIQSFDENERTDIAAKISASFHNPVMSASLNVDISSSKETSRNDLNVNVFVYQGGGMSTTETELSQMIEKAHSFPGLVSGPNAIPYQVILDEYAGLALPSDNLNFIDIAHQTETLLFNSRLLANFSSLINDIDFIRQHSDRFHNIDGSPPDDSALKNARQSCVAIVDTLQTNISGCMNDANACTHFTGTPEDFINDLPILRLPKPGLLKVPSLLSQKAYTFPDVLHPIKNKPLVDLLLNEGFYFTVANPEALEFHVLGSEMLRDAGTITAQSPPEGTFVLKGTVISVTISPAQANHGPDS